MRRRRRKLSGRNQRRMKGMGNIIPHGQAFLWGKTSCQRGICKINSLERKNWRQSSFCYCSHRPIPPAAQQNEQPRQQILQVVTSRKWWYCYCLVFLLKFISTHTSIILLYFFQQDMRYQQFYQQPLYCSTAGITLLPLCAYLAPGAKGQAFPHAPADWRGKLLGARLLLTASLQHNNCPLQLYSQ